MNRFSWIGIAVFSLLMQSINGVNFVVPGVYFEDGNEQIMESEASVDVFSLFGGKCSAFKNLDACTDVMDGFSEILYGTAYTPRSLSRSREDLNTLRWDIVAGLIGRFQYRKYLEIGCDRDEVFGRVRDLVSTSVGVDPSKGGTLRMTSDTFFETNSEKFDLIYIDGDHDARQVIFDISNALSVLTEGGAIVMHDCNPRVEVRQIPTDRPTTHYNGDVWKVAVLLRLLPDYEIVIIDIDHGVGVVRKRPNRHLLPPEIEQRLLSAENALEAFTYQDLDTHRNIFLRLMSIVEYREWLEEV